MNFHSYKIKAKCSFESFVDAIICQMPLLTFEIDPVRIFIAAVNGIVKVRRNYHFDETISTLVYIQLNTEILFFQNAKRMQIIVIIYEERKKNIFYMNNIILCNSLIIPSALLYFEYQLNLTSVFIYYALFKLPL